MSVSNQRKRMSKQERAERRREEAIRRKFRRRGLWIGSAVVVIGALFGWLYMNQPILPGEKVEVMEDQSHIPDVTSTHTPYNSDPPTSGPHVESIANWGVHKDSLPKELLVHNLEDGGVVIYYNNQVEKETIEKLESLVNEYKTHVILTPYPEMADRIALTAWGRIDRLSEFDEERITQFIDRFKGIDHH